MLAKSDSVPSPDGGFVLGGTKRPPKGRRTVGTEEATDRRGLLLSRALFAHFPSRSATICLRSPSDNAEGEMALNRFIG